MSSPDTFSKGPGASSAETLRVVIADDSPGIGGGARFEAVPGDLSPTVEDLGGDVLYGVNGVDGSTHTLTLPNDPGNEIAVGTRVIVQNFTNVTTLVAAPFVLGRAAENPTPVVGEGAYAVFTYIGADGWMASLDTGPRTIDRVSVGGTPFVIDDTNWFDYHGKILLFNGGGTGVDIQTTIDGFQCVIFYDDNAGTAAEIFATGNTLVGGGTSVWFSEQDTATVFVDSGNVYVTTAPRQAASKLVNIFTPSFVTVFGPFGAAEYKRLNTHMLVTDTAPTLNAGILKGHSFSIHAEAALTITASGLTVKGVNTTAGGFYMDAGTTVSIVADANDSIIVAGATP